MPEGFVPPPETKQFWDALREQLEDMADECWQDLEGERYGEPLPNGSWQTLMQLWEDGVWKPDVERDGRANTEGTEEWWVEELAEEEPTEEDSLYVRVHGGPQVLRERAGTE